MPTVTDDTAAVNPLQTAKAMLEAAGQQLDTLHERVAAGELSFEQAARALRQTMDEAGTCGEAALLDSLQPDSEIIEVEGVEYRRLPTPSRGVYVGLRGCPVVVRPLYRQVGVRNGPTVDPVALRAVLVEGRMTPSAARATADLLQASPSREIEQGVVHTLISSVLPRGPADPADLPRFNGENRAG